MARGEGSASWRLHDAVQNDICAAMRLIERTDLTAQTVGITQIKRLAAELRAALEQAYSESGSGSGSFKSS